MLIPGQEIELAIEKPVAGGRMIARHNGQVVLVMGAIPGERVLARIDRIERRLLFASTVDVISVSADRRTAFGDPLCGGCLYSHIKYVRQLAIKSEVIADALTRIGHIPVMQRVDVLASPEQGYRLRSRLHVQAQKMGFYREGTHELCDARATAQLTDEAIDAAEFIVAGLRESSLEPISLEMSENIAGLERAVHLEVAARGAIGLAVLERIVDGRRVTGCTAVTLDGHRATVGRSIVADPLNVLTQGGAPSGFLERHPESFFQGNRYLLPDLVAAVLAQVPGTRGVLDLYAGVGLFAVALAATGRTDVTAVERDRSSGADLQRNAAPYAPALRVVIGRVEDHVKGRAAGTIIVDPPRAGISRRAMDAIATAGARRIVYISCDAPTLARDARRLLDSGYRLEMLRSFDFFPNTPHVETLAVFERGDS